MELIRIPVWGVTLKWAALLCAHMCELCKRCSATHTVPFTHSAGSVSTSLCSLLYLVATYQMPDIQLAAAAAPSPHRLHGTQQPCPCHLQDRECI